MGVSSPPIKRLAKSAVNTAEMMGDEVFTRERFWIC